MAKSINKVELLGRVGADPEMKYTASGIAVTQLRLATDRVRKGGESETDWHQIVVWDKLAEACANYVEKGQRLYVAGRWRRTPGPATTGSGATAPRFTPRRWCSWTPPATAAAATTPATALPMGSTPAPTTRPTPETPTDSTLAVVTSPATRTLPSNRTLAQ